MGNSEKAVEDAVISYLLRSLEIDGVAVGRFQSMAESKETVKIYVSAQPFEDFRYGTETPYGKIPLQIVVSSYIPDDPDGGLIEAAVSAYEEAWAGAIESDLTDISVYVVDGIVIGKGSRGFNDQGHQQKIYEYELYGHKT